MELKDWLNSVNFTKENLIEEEIIKQYYGYSNEKALSALKILTPDQINFIKQRLDIGGIR
jgi:hypothetical protein